MRLSSQPVHIGGPQRHTGVTVTRLWIERFFGRVLVFFRLQRPPVFGWSRVDTRVAHTYAAVWVIALSAWQAGRPDLIRSPRLVLAHVWEGVEV